MKYAPSEIRQDLVDSLISDAWTVVECAKDGSEGGSVRTFMTACDVARARVRREKESCPLGKVHAEIARGEMGLILGIMELKEGGKAGVPVEWLREWISEERLPEGWKPTRAQGFFDTRRRSKAIRLAMDKMREDEENEKLGARHSDDTTSATSSTLNSVPS